MARNTDYSKYAKKHSIDTQSVYVDSGSAYKIVEELKALERRRILLITDKENRKSAAYDKLVDHYNKSSFKVFEYVRDEDKLYDTDVFTGLGIYKDYNCDVIIAIGKNDTIECSKLIAALAHNPVKSLNDLVGVGKLKSDIPYLCCMGTDINPSISSCFADYIDSQTGKISTVVSLYLVPHIVVIDSDLSVRTDIQTCLHNALMALSMAIETYLNSDSDFNLDYKANALNASLAIMNSIDSFKNDPTDIQIRRKIMMGAYYAGLCTRKVGIGPAHVLMHALISKYNYRHSTGMAVIFPAMLMAQRDSDEKTRKRMANLARELHLCTNSLDDGNASLNLIDRINYLYRDIERLGYYPKFSESEAKKLSGEVFKECQNMGVNLPFDKETLYTVISSVSDNSL